MRKQDRCGLHETALAFELRMGLVSCHCATSLLNYGTKRLFGFRFRERLQNAHALFHCIDDAFALPASCDLHGPFHSFSSFESDSK